MKSAITKFFLPCFALALAALVSLTGCGHYRLGTGSRPTFASIYIAPVQNKADAPQATAVVSARLREAFLRDGRVALTAAPEEADALLVVTLTRYGRETLTALAADTGRARKLNLALEATATLTDRRTGRTLFERRPLHADRQIFTDSGQLQAEYDAVPLLAEQLAQAASRATLDTW